MSNDNTDLIDKLSALKIEQGKLSREIGRLKKQGSDFSTLVSDMQQLSGAIKQLEKKVGTKKAGLTAEKSSANTKKQDALRALPYRDLNPVSAVPADLSGITIKMLEQSSSANWDAFVESNLGNVYWQKAAWASVIEAEFGHRTYYLYAVNSVGHWLGVLPLVEMRSRLFGHFYVSVPCLNYGGAYGVNKEIENLLMEKANSLAKNTGASYVEYRDECSRSVMPARTDKIAMILPLKRDENALLASFSSKLRSQIKRSSREDLTCSIGKKENLDDFYTVFSQNMRDLGTPVYAKTFFQKILAAFADEVTIVVIRHAGKPVSAAFLMRSGQCMEVPWASTIRSANKLNANMFLYWQLLAYSCRQGCAFFDFGRSSKGAGTYKFKKQWGAVEKSLYWHYWLADGVTVPQLNPNNPKYRLLIRIWKLLPVWLATMIGPHIVKNIP